MAVSPFTFYRGAAKVMAGDLASTQSSGLDAQLCGDAHLANFGSYASPDRRQVFDVNDFDETLPGPWEWDLKRMATSFVLAGRDNGFDKSVIRSVTAQSVAGYRQAMAKFAAQRTLDVWYAQGTVAQIAAAAPEKKERKQISKAAAKARSKDSLKALSKLAEQVDGKYRINSQPPLLLPLRDLATSMDPDALREQVTTSLQSYRNTLADNRRVLFDRFDLVDIALKVVGVGSVGARVLASYDVRVEPVLADDAEWAARRWRSGEGFSLADRLCLALAERIDTDVLTADAQWGSAGRVRQVR